MQKRSHGSRKTAGGAGRGASFTEQELKSFLDILEIHFPVGGDEWDAVTCIHKTRYPDTKRTTDSLRRKFSLLYRKKAPTGDPRIPVSVLRAKTLRQDMTARVDLGDGECSELDGLGSVEDLRLEEQDDPSSLGVAVECEDGEGDIRARSSSPSIVSPAFPIVHKRSRNGRSTQDDDRMKIVKASLIQEREFRLTERERAEREQQEARERREEEARNRAFEREEERKRRQDEREEAQKQGEESRKNRDTLMQAFMMYLAKPRQSDDP